MDMLRRSGGSDKLKCQLRAKLFAELALRSDVVVTGISVKPSLLFNVVDSMLLDYFKARGLDYTLSVFVPETGATKHVILLVVATNYV